MASCSHACALMDTLDPSNRIRAPHPLRVYLVLAWHGDGRGIFSTTKTALCPVEILFKGALQIAPSRNSSTELQSNVL